VNKLKGANLMNDQDESTVFRSELIGHDIRQLALCSSDLFSFL
jgi:hypothetical protein